MRRNPAYWRRNLPRLEAITWRYVPSDEERVRLIESGYYLYTMTTVDVNITAADNGTYTVDSISTASLTYEDLKDKEPDAKVTQALDDIKAGLSEKLNETKGAEFTQGEIKIIKDRYSLTNEEVGYIFFQ